MGSVCTGLQGEEGRVSTSVDTRLYKPNTFTFKRLLIRKVLIGKLTCTGLEITDSPIVMTSI